jgi:hypothetical protein
MASLEDLLDKTLLFVAAKESGQDPMGSLRRAPSAPMAFAPPKAEINDDHQNQPVWHWKHDPQSPAKVDAVQAFARGAGPKGMLMPVCSRVEVESVTIKVKSDDDVVNLPLTPKYALTKFFLEAASMKERKIGWWRLAANLDHSMLVVSGYELQRASGVDPKPLDMGLIQKLGERFFPDPDVPSGDPDAPETPRSPSSISAPPAVVSVHQSVDVYMAPTWVIVAFGFTTCKERADFEPGRVLGAGRMYPHVMVACNHAATEVECKIHVVRPATTAHSAEHGMAHPEMNHELRAVMFADTNESQSIVPDFIPGPLPIWSNFFDYYDLHPPVGTEFKFVDPKRTNPLPIVGAIRREQALHVPGVYESTSTFTKKPLQGEFYNLHIAPRMKYSKKGIEIDDIAMAPFCEHDCLHTHTRWGIPNPSVPDSNWGFKGRIPFAEKGATLVPGNQTVYVSLSTPASFRYRAVAAGPIRPGTFSVFNHHGSGYALAIDDAFATWFTMTGAKAGIWGNAVAAREPYVRIKPGFIPIPPFVPVPELTIEHVDPTESSAAFYYRLQMTGTILPDDFKPRIDIKDLSACRKG